MSGWDGMLAHEAEHPGSIPTLNDPAMWPDTEPKETPHE